MPREKAKLHAISNENAARSAASQRTKNAAEPNVCKICFGTGMEIVEGKGARPCSCRTRQHSAKRFEHSRIPKRYEHCFISNYSTENSSQRAAKEAATELAHEYPATDIGLLLTGKVGVGKTHLAVSIVKMLTERGFACLFYEFGSLLKEIQDSYNPNTKTSELSILRPVLEADVLVLDELGASKPTDWVRDTMAHIINTRYNDRRLTIFTTNYPDERGKEQGETLEERIGARLRSRLFEMCRAIEIRGDDYRRRSERENTKNLASGR